MNTVNMKLEKIIRVMMIKKAVDDDFIYEWVCMISILHLVSLGLMGTSLLKSMV